LLRAETLISLPQAFLTGLLRHCANI
jgi:hypothetical protein